MRGAVPAPNENPCMPCRSLDAHKANIAIAISAIPPTKSCGPRTHFGMMDLTGPWLGVSLIDLSPRHRAFPPFGLDSFDAARPSLASPFSSDKASKTQTPPGHQHPKRVKPRRKIQHRRHPAKQGDYPATIGMQPQ